MSVMVTYFNRTLRCFVAQRPRNPLAVGHMINHPPANELPNVIAFPYDFPMRGESFFIVPCMHLIRTI